MRAASTFTAIGIALWLAAPTAFALGFGRVSNATQLGQPLDFAAAVRLDADELLPRECVSAEVVSGDNKLLPTQVRVTLENGADASDRNVRITTSTLIDEPVVTVSVTLGCASKVTRKFVAFVDPPLINAAQSTPMEPLAQQRNDSQVAPIVTMLQGETQPPPPSKPVARTPSPRSVPRIRVAAAPSSAASTVEPAAPRAAAPPKPASTSRQATARPQPSGPRLKLEAAAPVVAAVASAAASARIPTAAASAAATDLTLALAQPASAAAVGAAASSATTSADPKERQRLQDLEDGVAKLRAESQATQASLAALQLRLKDAESERYANPVVYALAWLSALLALAVAGLWWRQSRARHSAQWWSGPAAASRLPAMAAKSRAPAESSPAPLGVLPTAADAFDVSAVMRNGGPPSEVPTVIHPVEPVAPTRPAALQHEPPRELSVEELIDLEQQAEFFVVLGQDEAAIELLMSHVRSDGGISPLPYLKLLEIYRRRGDGDAYERIRERFNRRFNAYAPGWDADLQHGFSLTDYPETIARLQSLWASPARVMETLDASLFRRNNTDATFDLPAYRELLFLYSIARDLAEHGGAGRGDAVDVLLPLSDDGDEPISRLMATAPGEFRASDIMTLPLDLDVSFGPPSLHDEAELPPQRATAAPEQLDSGFLDFDLTSPIKSPKAGNR